jgi:hypothetical protein
MMHHLNLDGMISQTKHSINSFGKIKNSKPYYMLNNITTKIYNNYKFRIKILNEL